LDNLLSNAVKFTPEGGQVLVSLRQQEAKKVVLQVSDNGVGIPNALQDSVFDKFTKANRQGTGGEITIGLGLFIAKQIVELHQGKIWLESREQEGTTFYVELPVV
jgi:two-component system sensor histidine kinase VicK